MHSPLFVERGGFALAGQRVARQGKLVVAARRMRVELVLMAHHGAAVQRQPVRLRQDARQRVGEA